MFVVTTRRLLPPSLPAVFVHCALDSPCHDAGCGLALGGVATKRRRRVCVPASVSMRSVLASCQVMCRRPGTFMMAAAPYDLHWLPAFSSAAGSHALMRGSAAGLAGILRYSPLAGVT